MTLWSIDFYGHLLDEDRARLDSCGVEWEVGGSEVGPRGEVREGVARNRVTVEADDEGAAQRAVEDALGPKAADCSEWHVAPAQRS